MNNKIIVAWMQDWHMSAKLAKISESYSFQLIFYEKLLKVPNSIKHIVIIIDFDSLNENDIKDIKKIKKNEFNFIIGYSQDMNSAKKLNLTKLGCDMVLKSNELIKNLDGILKKYFNIV